MGEAGVGFPGKHVQVDGVRMGVVVRGSTKLYFFILVYFMSDTEPFRDLKWDAVVRREWPGLRFNSFLLVAVCRGS